MRNKRGTKLRHQDEDSTIRKNVFNNLDNCKTSSQVSSPELFPMTSDSERLMQKRGDTSFLTILRQAGLRNEAMQKPGESLKSVFESDTEGFPFNPTTEQAPALAVNPFISKQLLTSQLKDAMRQTAIQEVKRIYVEQSGWSTEEMAGDALRNVFFARLQKVNSGFKNETYHFVEGVLSKATTKGSLHDMFERHHERWTQSFSLTDAFT